MSSPPPFPAIEPGGSLLLAWQLRSKRALLIGGGAVAAGRLSSLLSASALVTLISPLSGLSPEVHHRIFTDPYSSSRITYYDRTWEGEGDLELDGGAEMVLTAIDDVDVSRAVCEAARRRRIPVNVADVPPECDFYFGSQIRDGPLQILVSTGGKGPKIANIIRRRIERALPPGVGGAIDKVGELRRRLRVRAPGVGGELGKRRMEWMIGVCEEWSLEELGGMDEAAMERLLDEGWEKGRVPPPAEVGVGGVSGGGWLAALKSERVWSPVVGALAGAAVTMLIMRRR